MKKMFRIKSILALVAVLSIASCSSDDDSPQPINYTNYTKTIKPDATEGQDAFIYEFNVNQQLGAHPDFMVGRYNGNETRNLIRFDFSDIPTNAVVDSVKISLYSYQSTSNGSHAGANASKLQRVTSTWDESTVTWSNQPTSTSVDEVLLDQTTSTIQDYLDIDVTLMARVMIANPSQNFGFLFRLQDNSGADKKMVFASSDNTDSDLHPKIDVYYRIAE